MQTLLYVRSGGRLLPDRGQRNLWIRIVEENVMSLAERAYRIDHLVGHELVIDDQRLLDWATEHRISPFDAQLEALRNGIVPLRYLKNFHSIDLLEQIRICSSKVLVCGCGGLGGVLINLLARTGVGHLRVLDSDVFVTSNLNRQWLCDTRDIDRPKAPVAEERARSINPFILVESLNLTLNEENAEELMRGMDLVLDALDNIPGRYAAAGAAIRLAIPFIHAAVAGWWGQVSTFLPGSSRDLKNIYGRAHARDRVEESMGVLGPTAAVIGSLEALEAMRILAGRKPAYADRLLYFDGEGGQLEIIPL
jgi:molybdopterin-synthase adenylyltransferase